MENQTTITPEAAKLALDNVVEMISTNFKQHESQDALIKLQKDALNEVVFIFRLENELVNL